MDVLEEAKIMKSSLKVWSNKNYLLLFITAVFVTFSGKVYELAVPLIVYNLTKSSVSMGTLTAIEYLPNMLLAVFIGAIIDRVLDKKMFMVFSVLFQSILLFLLYQYLKSSYFEMSLLYVIIFILMTLNYCYYNIRFGIVKFTLPPSLYGPATANFTFVTQLVSVLGPAIAGFILLLSDINNSLLITSGCLFITAIVCMFLDSTKDEEVKRDFHLKSLFIDIKEAWNVFKGLKGLWVLTWVVVFSNAAFGMFSAMLIYFAKESLSLDNSKIGILLSFMGMGGVLGSLIFNVLNQRVGVGNTISLSVLFTGIAYCGVALVTNYYLVCLFLLVIGIFTTTFSISVHTYRQEVTPSRFIGRIVGITGSLFKIAMPFFIYSSGWITELFNVSLAFMISGLMMLVLFLVFTTRKSRYEF